MRQDRFTDALILAAEAHDGQRDKGGAAYILHPLRVALAVAGEDAKIAAILHDTVEDSGVGLELIKKLFGEKIADAVDALSRRPGESYDAFILRCAANPIARVVKLADLADNMDASRLGRDPTAADNHRLAKYSRARAVLLAAS